MTHLFVSYSRLDFDIVERIINDLKAKDISVWFDKTGLVPGTESWEQALRNAIQDADAILLMASHNSRKSGYVRDEVALADSAGKKIYPVWVAGEKWLEAIPLGYGSRQFVDVRGDAYAAGLASLLEALQGKSAFESAVQLPPNVEKVEDIPKNPDRPTHPRNPYKGLRAFSSQDAGDFFGRELFIEQMLEKFRSIHQVRLLGVLGASGSGKSSVVMAGFVPRLKAGAVSDSKDWLYIDAIKPSDNPVERLAISLGRLMPEKTYRMIYEELADKDTRGLHRLGSQLTDKAFFLYIDQFEEIFTMTEDTSQRRHFIELINTATTVAGGLCHVVFSMRADFYDRLGQFGDFAGNVRENHILMTDMSIADIYDVISKPVFLPDVQVTFDEGLVTEMLLAVRNEAGSLPLLQFTLAQLFEQRQGYLLGKEAYQKLGGVQGAIAHHAEAIYATLPSEAHREMTKALFLRLVDIGEEGKSLLRRRIHAEELISTDMEKTRIMSETKDIFVKQRLLTTDADLVFPQEDTSELELKETKSSVEISHEVLISAWERLANWVNTARDDIRIQKRIQNDARFWLDTKHNEALLYRGTVLLQAEDWLKRNLASRDETMFIHQSREQENQQIAEKQKNTRRLRILGFGLIAVVLLASILTTLAFARSNSLLQAEAAQAAYLATRVPGLGGLPISFEDMTSTAPAVFYATMTAAAELNQWIPVIKNFNCNENTENCIEMVEVPAGCFYMGSYNGDSDETPVHELCFESSFWIDRYEVSQAQFETHGGIADNLANWDDLTLPRTSVSWYEAYYYCQERGATLPTEAQWEYAAKGNFGTQYPWGNDFMPDYLAFDGNSIDPSSVEAFDSGTSWVGAHNLAGNVWEWVNTAYGYDFGSNREFDTVNDSLYTYPYRSDDGRETYSEDTMIVRVYRGGSFISSPVNHRSANRNFADPSRVHLSIGFRCVRVDE
jgi:formylglycine-generating enzyme required for sulfatase activity